MQDTIESLSASDLFAVSQGSANLGSYECHWCGSKCMQDWRHDEPPSVPFVKNKNQARYPANHWICIGCWLWRRPRVTVSFLDGSYKDGQTASNHSWWVTDKDAKAINQSCKSMLHSVLLKPPNSFVLSLKDPSYQNNLHLAVANDISVIKADTILYFTLNNVVSSYSVYDLETALKDKEACQSPGVRLLLDWFSPWEVQQRSKVQSVGKPKEIMVTETTKKIIQKSGC